MPKPGLTILYVDNPPASAALYERLLGCASVEVSATFAMFAFPSGVRLGLWARPAVVPAATAAGCGGELAFTVDSAEQVDATCQAWRALGLPILQEPAQVDFGHTFVALDPDGHRLRAVCPFG
ncbi:VOC family protein [Azorhizobium sp. AG788]|uniref:VOC family protein n=1 Tax=Azorhizobium sp. AG788 TaxID=2183897 RepID=UPI0031391998